MDSKDEWGFMQKSNVVSKELQNLLTQMKSACQRMHTTTETARESVLRVVEQGRKEGIADMQIRDLIRVELKEVFADRTIRQFLPEELKLEVHQKKESSSKELSSNLAGPPSLAVQNDQLNLTVVQNVVEDAKRAKELAEATTKEREQENEDLRRQIAQLANVLGSKAFGGSKQQQQQELNYKELYEKEKDARTQLEDIIEGQKVVDKTFKTADQVKESETILEFNAKKMGGKLFALLANKPNALFFVADGVSITDVRKTRWL